MNCKYRDSKIFDNLTYYMKIIPNINCLLLFILFSAEKINAQKTPLNFKSYSSRDGLSSGTVYNILKDSFGFLWFGTEDGLNRFDGTNFKIYKHNPAKPGGLRVNHITALYEDKGGCIWIGTNGGGLSFYDKSKDSIFNYLAKGPIPIGDAVTSVNGDQEGNVWVTSFGGLFAINPKNKELITGRFTRMTKELVGKVSLSFLQDKKQRIWVGSAFGLYLFNPVTGDLKLFKHVEGDKNSLADDNVDAIAEDTQGNIWAGTANGLSMWIPQTNQFRNLVHTMGTPRISSNRIYALAADGNKQLWIGTDEGLDVLDITTNILSSYTPDIRNPGSISSRSIRSIFIDKKGIHWVGTFRGGVNKYDKNYNHFNLKEYKAFDPGGLHSPFITSFAEYQNNVFIGTDGGGLQFYHRNTDLVDHINLPITEINNNHDLTILALEMTRNSHLWIGTYMNGLYCYYPATGAHKRYTKGSGPTDLNSDDIFCLKEDRNGNLWVGTNGGGVNLVKPGSNQIDKFMFDPLRVNDPSLPASNYIRSIEEDRAGRIWIGTYGSGLSVFDPVSQKFIFYTKGNSGLPSDYVLSIKEDSRGNVWIGTSGNGMGLLRKGSKRFESLTEKDGLANGTIQTIIEDASGKIWLSTNQGLSRYDRATRKFSNYSNYDGLQAGAFMTGAGLKLADGELFFGGQNGFNYFNPSNLKTNQNIPQVVLTDLKVDNLLVSPSENAPIDQSMLLADKIRLKYKQGFSIAFEALDFTVPEANQYEYQLKGFDKNWIRAGKEHSANYGNIPPGEYTFQVRASNNDGIWNQEGRSIKVLVAPPYWRTNYAFLAYIFILAAILLYLRQLSIKRIQMRFSLKQEREQAKQLIERERKEAEYLHKLDQMKIKFLTNLSHEFRTPISLIIGPVDNLIAEVKDEAPLNYLNLIKRNTRRLLNLVNQLLDFRKMEEHELKLQCSEGDIVFFIKDVCDSFNDVARRKEIDFRFYTELATLPVMFDHDKVERILFNILSNAFKFTSDKGHITARLKEAEVAQEEGCKSVSISISDSGIGIPKDVQTRIFESFFQHDTGSQVLTQGTGIGLSITKEFVKMHNGKIWVESEVGKGSTFTIHLKLKEAGQMVAEAQQAQMDSSNDALQSYLSKNKQGSEPSLLIVEDDDDFRFYIKENLESVYRIYEAPNGKEGWQRTLFHHPDIIVCDVQMPIMNGLQLAQKLKSDKRTKHIPIILLTAADSFQGTIDGLESGAIDYMTKPFDFTVLKAKIHNILLLNQSFKDTYSKQVTVGLPETEAVSDKDIFLKKALTYIYDNLDNPQLSVEVLSTHLCISRASLYNKLLEFTGMSPVEFIRNVKLEKAKGLLEKSGMTVTEVAYETGFANPNYFAKVFKAKYSMTPSEFHEEKKKRGK